MTTFSARSSNGRTDWILVDGRLREVGPESPSFTLSVEDTFLLYKLFAQAQNDILDAVKRERALTHKDIMSLDTRYDALRVEDL